MKCKVCDREIHAKGLCRRHYEKNRKYGEPIHGIEYNERDMKCKVCDSEVLAKGLCRRHYLKNRKYGEPVHGIEYNERNIGSINNGYRMIHGKSEHRQIIEEILGKKIPSKSVVHHIDGERSNNKKDNLILCDSSGYHKILHTRAEALKESGHGNWKKCAFCKTYDDPIKMYVRKNGNQAWHRECMRISKKTSGEINANSKRG